MVFGVIAKVYEPHRSLCADNLGKRDCVLRAGEDDSVFWVKVEGNLTDIRDKTPQLESDKG